MHGTARFEGSEVDGDKSNAINQLYHKLFGFDGRNRFFSDDACPRRVVILLAAAYAAAHSVASSSA